MAKRKICVVVTSRASYARIKSVLRAIQGHPKLELQLIVSASALLQRFGGVVEIMRSEGFRPTSTVYVVIEGETPATMAKSTGLAIIELATQFENLSPDVVVTVADRYETMATGVAASYMNIVLAHVQGGEVTGSIDESVRHAVTKLAHIHFATTPLSRDRLIRLGEQPERVHLTGCPSIDILRGIDLSVDGLFEKYGGVGAPIDPGKPWLVVLQHPVTTEFDRAWDQVQETLAAIRELRMQTIWIWPNVDAGSDAISKGLRVFREQERPDYVHFYRNLPPDDFARLIHNCACLVGNSSVGVREASFLGVPSVNIGSRQDGRERGPNVIDVGFERAAIVDAVRAQVAHGKFAQSTLYGDGHAGRRIAEILAGPLPMVQKRLTY